MAVNPLERDALAAHVDRLHMAWVDAKRCVSEVALPSLYRVEQYQQLAKHSIEKVESVASDAPATSLTQRDAEMQARALDEAAEHTTPAMHKMAEWLRSRARWIRKHGTETGA